MGHSPMVTLPELCLHDRLLPVLDVLGMEGEAACPSGRHSLRWEHGCKSRQDCHRVTSCREVRPGRGGGGTPW